MEGVCVAGGMAGGMHGRYYEIWSMSGRYASYWNPFLLFDVNIGKYKFDLSVKYLICTFLTLYPE